mgnify:FL=1
MIYLMKLYSNMKYNRQTLILSREVKMTENATDNIEKINLYYKNIAEMGKYSFELEDKREENILLQAGQMLSAISLFSAGLLMATPIIIEYTSLEIDRLLWIICIVGVEVWFSLLMAIIAQWRYKGAFMLNAKEIEEELKKEKEVYQCQGQYDYQWIVQISSLHEYKRKNNDKRVRCCLVSMISFLLSILTLLIGLLIAALF